MNPLTGGHGSLPSTALISAMITPAILILATGSLVTSTLTRLSRVVDRTRFLIERLQQALREGDDVRAETNRMLLRRYTRRNALVERALSAYYLAIGFFVAACLAIAFDNFMRDTVPWLAPALTVAGAIVMLLGTIAIFLETNMAHNIMVLEIQLTEPPNSRELQER
jgi:hypothetical protein